MGRYDIDIDEELLSSVMERFRFGSATEAVDAALRGLAADSLTVDEALGLRGAGLIAAIPEDLAPS